MVVETSGGELQCKTSIRKLFKLIVTQDKIAYVFLGHFTEKGKTNGWYADSYLRTHLSRQGLRLVSGLRDDDIFLYLDADELPTREMLLFLKARLHVFSVNSTINQSPNTK